MKHVVRKAYWDFEKEETWLNQMSMRGLALIDYSWCRYVFEQARPNEYIYRIELLENPPSHPQSASYIEFLEENGVECVATYMRWLYLRKKAADGPFDIYTDPSSKVKHYKRILAFWSIFICMQLGAGALNVILGIVLGNMTNLILGMMVLGIGFSLYTMNIPLFKKVKKLEQDRIIRE